MIGALLGLRREREAITRRIALRQQRIRGLGQECRQHGREWMGTTRSLVQAFLAGFLVDQARPLLPGEASPLKLGLLILFRRLEWLVRGET
jgi:hypothetical protein